MIRLIWKSARHHWGLQLVTVFIILVSVSLIFSTWLLQQGLKNGLEKEQERLGADLLVVPNGVTVEPGEILYGGSPQNIYMSQEVEAGIQSVSGVERVSVQFFSQTLQADCCDFGEPLRLVGIDPQTDGLAAAWSRDGKTSQMQPDEIFTGSRVAAKTGQHFFILGRMFRVAGVLEPSGSGLDKSILMDLSVARELANQAPQLRGALLAQGGADQLISAVLVKLVPSANAAAVRAEIARRGNVQVFSSVETKQRLYRNLHGFVVLLAGILGVIALAAFLQLGTRLYAEVGERLAVFGLYLALGASPAQLVALVSLQAMLLCTVGGLIGLLAGYGLYAWLEEILVTRQSFPFLPVDLWLVLGSGLVVLLACLLMAAAAAALPAMRCARIEPRLILTRGEVD